MTTPKTPSALVQLSFVRRVLSAVAAHEGERLFWEVTPECVRFFIDCGNVFDKAHDRQEITPDNVGLLEESYADARKACKFGEIHGQLLFCCRVRQSRPRRSAYPSVKTHAKLWPLINACGTEVPFAGKEEAP